MGNSPLFNPYSRAGSPTTIDRLDASDEQQQEDETETPESSPEPADDTPPVKSD
jgi:hypothetical protein